MRYMRDMCYMRYLLYMHYMRYGTVWMGPQAGAPRTRDTCAALMIDLLTKEERAVGPPTSAPPPHQQGQLKLDVTPLPRYQVTCVASHRQAQLMLDVYAEVLNELQLPFVAVIDFSWFPPECVKCGGVESGGCVGSGAALEWSQCAEPHMFLSLPSLRATCSQNAGQRSHLILKARPRRRPAAPPAGAGAGLSAGGTVRVGRQLVPGQRVLDGDAGGVGRPRGGKLFVDRRAAKPVSRA